MAEPDEDGSGQTREARVTHSWLDVATRTHTSNTSPAARAPASPRCAILAVVLILALAAAVTLVNFRYGQQGRLMEMS